MKKYIIPIVIVVAFGVYILLNSEKSMPVATPDLSNNGTAGNTTTTTSGTGSDTSSTAAGTPNATTSTQTAGAYKDGAYTSPVSNAFYGDLQLKVTIAHGKLSDITFLKYPSDNGETRTISNSSLPVLKQEAITSQSANVNIVSGATQTSEAFQTALKATLAMAQ